VRIKILRVRALLAFMSGPSVERALYE